MLSIPSPSLRRMATAVNARRYATACVCLLIVAAALRFYDLPKNSLWHDEAVAAIIARGTISEVIINAGTRYSNTSPVLYPIVLWAVQKAASTEVSVRLMPAAASLLTVAALLFLMPRVGVPRRVAFLAALLAALSAAAIEHAQDAREYSVDALVATLIIAGTLQYLRNGRKTLLCGALFVAPLLQYGLVLFGVAALSVAALAPTAFSGYACSARRTLAAAIWERLKRRIDLILPGACFAAACVLTWALTARYQWVAGGWGRSGYLEDFYYQGGYDAATILEFSGNRIWSLLSYHMQIVIAATALIALGALLPLALKRRRCDAIALLALFAVGIALCAAVMGVYPMGGSRHNLYLGPIVFLAAGSAFNSLAADVATIARHAWLAPALTAAAAAAAIAVAGAAAVRHADTYYAKDASMAQVLAALDERKREGDAVYVSRYEVPAVSFYKYGKPADYFYGKAVCWGDSWGATSWAECFPAILDEMFRMSNNSRRIWFIHNSSVSVPKEMAAHSQETAVEEIVDDGWTTLHLITGFDELAANIREEWLDMHADFASDTPSAAASYNLYLQDDALYYAKQPCAPADTEARFFLHIYPTDAAVLPSYRRQYGFDNLDFAFHDYGIRIDDRCIIRRALPEYAVDRINAGQFVPPSGPRVWEAELQFKQ